MDSFTNAKVKYMNNCFHLCMMLLEKPGRRRGYKKERIIRALLSKNEDFTKYKLAKEAEVSEPWCREYTSKLENTGVIKNTTVVDHEQLYSKWEEIHISSNSIRVSLQDPLEFMKRTQLSYALTTYKAENLYQGFLFPSIIDFYIKEDERRKWLDLVKKKGFIGGGNTRIRITDEHVFYKIEKTGGLYTVSLPQLILDLRLEGGPCKEAAEKLMNRYHGVE